MIAGVAQRAQALRRLVMDVNSRKDGDLLDVFFFLGGFEFFSFQTSIIIYLYTWFFFCFSNQHFFS